MNVLIKNCSQRGCGMDFTFEINSIFIDGSSMLIDPMPKMYKTNHRNGTIIIVIYMIDSTQFT